MLLKRLRSIRIELPMLLTDLLALPARISLAQLRNALADAAPVLLSSAARSRPSSRAP